MRADIIAPCDPSLPSGVAHTPGSPPSSTTPHTRKRKQNTHRIRHGGPSSSSSGNNLLFHPLTGSSLSSSADALHLPRGSSSLSSHMPPVGDPQTLQEKKELLEYFQKLRVLVPSLPKTGKIPKLDVIEHVIHYIKQLESQLIDHPMIQVLENNAYISGLIQSMAPEFDISHLFPSRTTGLNNHHSDDTTITTTSQPQQPTSSTIDALNLQQNLYGRRTSSSSSNPLRLKTKRSSVRKPLSVLSSTNHCTN